MLARRCTLSCIVGSVSGGIAVSGNLLCVAYTDVRGKVFLVDLDDERIVSQWSYTGADGGYADAGGVAMDAAYNIYVADAANDTVRRFTAFGREIARFGQRPDRLPGAAARDRQGILDQPAAVAVLGRTLFVACGDRKLIRGVQCIDVDDGRVLGHLRSFGESEGRFGAPRGLAVTPEVVLVADTLHGAIQRFRPDGSYVCQFTTAGDYGEASRPVAVLPLAGGDVLVADHGDHKTLKRFSLGGELRPPGPLPLPLDEPTGLAADRRGRVFVLDRGGERVQRLTRDLAFDGTLLDLAEIGFGI
jgi:DNA-binding beta-propeller fold protein YncE